MTKKEKKVTKNNPKVYLLWWTILALFVMVFVLFSRWYEFESASANPDYICIKEVSNPSCNITSCGEWTQDWIRECTWIAYSKQAYYSTRVACAEGWNAYEVWNNNWASWRRTADFNLVNDFKVTQCTWGWPNRTCTTRVLEYATSQACTVIQEDHNAPSWNWYDNVVNP
jgi:hypothetical protein